MRKITNKLILCLSLLCIFFVGYFISLQSIPASSSTAEPSLLDSIIDAVVVDDLSIRFYDKTKDGEMPHIIIKLAFHVPLELDKLPDGDVGVSVRFSAPISKAVEVTETGMDIYKEGSTNFFNKETMFVIASPSIEAHALYSAVKDDPECMVVISNLSEWPEVNREIPIKCKIENEGIS